LGQRGLKRSPTGANQRGINPHGDHKGGDKGDHKLFGGGKRFPEHLGIGGTGDIKHQCGGGKKGAPHACVGGSNTRGLTQLEGGN